MSKDATILSDELVAFLGANQEKILTGDDIETWLNENRVAKEGKTECLGHFLIDKTIRSLNSQ